MHSGFYALRKEMPMDFVNIPGFPDASESAKGDITRVVAIWQNVRQQFGAGGPFLFGQFSAADAMFAPVASRFTTYTPDLAAFGDDGTAAAYRDMMMALPEMQEWARGATEELAARA
jgi:glutathione S-transferase